MKIIFETIDDQRRVAGPVVATLSGLLVPVIAAACLLTGGDFARATFAACGFAVGVTATSLTMGRGRLGRSLSGVMLMSQISLLVANGGEWQIDFHMAYFAVLALLVIYSDWVVILASAATVAVHHLVLSYALPAAVFGASAGLGRVGLHAVILIIEAAALMWICANLGNIFMVSRKALNEAEEFGANATRMIKIADAARHGQAQAEERGLASRHATEAERALVIDAIGEAISRLASKDLSHRLADGMPNAFLRLQTDFNRAINQFSDSLTLVKSSAANVLSESGEIAEAAQSLARLTEFQSGRLQETTATVMAITSAVQHTATGTKHARKIVASAKDDARHGDTTVQQAVGAMDKIQDSSRQITQIIGVIDEIAFQTNLLALNAGVEAARAGDAGRGFAVVATEVRLLAQRSAGAAREIKNLISMSSNQVLEGVSLVADTGKALERIVTRISEIDVVVTSIDQAGVEQEARLKEVASAVGELEGATRRNMGMAGKIVSASESFSEESRTLDSMLSEFTLAGADANVPPRESEGRAVAKDRPLAELFAA